MQADSENFREIFHAGERAMQRRAGVRDRLAELGPRVIREQMPDQHRTFFSLLPWLLVGSVDAQGQPWASVIAGEPGFVTSPHPTQLDVCAQPLNADPLRENLRAGAAVGLLGLQSHTRRRNRMNGRVENISKDCFSVTVQQSFGNCPKYIQAREAAFIGASISPVDVTRTKSLSGAAKKLIAGADTFFIASAHPAVVAPTDDFHAAEGVDISHRGGNPGFVHIEGDCLIAPDYAGNFFFNTLGNLMLEPRAGLLFIDFESGDLLQLAVITQIDCDVQALKQWRGAQRLLRMQVTQSIFHHGALPLVWGDAQPSPFLADF